MASKLLVRERHSRFRAAERILCRFQAFMLVETDNDDEGAGVRVANSL